jgi:hypothetical protein
MAPVILLRPRRRAGQHHIGAALLSVIDDVSEVERAIARLAWGGMLCGLLIGLALHALA